jgi:hypothetical protein
VKETNAEDGLPWYRFFWPWFIVGLLGTSVVAGVTTVVIAFRNQDSLVDDRYYETGNAINLRIAAEKNAERLGVRATLTLDDLTGEARIFLEGRLSPPPERLRLELSHATEAERDSSVTLVANEPGHFHGQLDAPAVGRFYAILRPSDAAGEALSDADVDWRLQQEIRLPSDEALRFGTAP